MISLLISRLGYIKNPKRLDIKLTVSNWSN